MRRRNGLFQPGEEDGGAHVAIEPGHEAAAEERGHRSEEGEDRERDQERQDARDDEDRDRVEPHGPQGIDLLAHLHGAELGRVGAAGAAGDHDGHDEDADLPEDEDADEIHDIVVGPELPEVEDALLGDDAADQEGDQEDDADRLPAHAVEMVDRGGQAEPARVDGEPARHRSERAEHREEGGRVCRQRGQAAADPGGEGGQAGRLQALPRFRPVQRADFLHQPLEALRHPGEARLAARGRRPPAHALEDPGAERVEGRDRREVDRDPLRAALGAGDARADPVGGVGVSRRP